MKYLVTLVSLFICTTLFSQKTEDSVKAVINKMFEAMLETDTITLRNCFSDSAILQTITKNGSVKTQTAHDFIRQISSLQKNTADERIKFSAIHIDGSLASAWTPYQFYYNGNFNHCGVNSFQLVRINGGWKIQYIIDTRRKEDCIE